VALRALRDQVSTQAVPVQPTTSITISLKIKKKHKKKNKSTHSERVAEDKKQTNDHSMQVTIRTDLTA
jgi:hypothetical protein